jgi:hypothetical protein
MDTFSTYAWIFGKKSSNWLGTLRGLLDAACGHAPVRVEQESLLVQRQPC